MKPNPDVLSQIRSKLKHLSLKSSPKLWLQTNIPDLNRVIGHADLGIPYGRIMEISGLESNGKTAISLALAALAQSDGAHVVWADFETSFAADWAILRGLAACPACKGEGIIKTGKEAVKCSDCVDVGERGLGLNKNKITLLQPYVGVFGAEKEPRLPTGPELLQECEDVIKLVSKRHDRLMLVVDSLPAIIPEGEAVVGIDETNMRTNMDLPMLLGRVLRRWVGMAMAHNMSIVLINQLRQNPMARFGDPWYTPGGNAPRFYSHVRVRVRRVKNSKIVQSGKLVGIKGVIRATKNKVGGIEGADCGFRLLYHGPIEFVPTAQVTKEEE
jgi:RecA/RadA recombinase